MKFIFQDSDLSQMMEEKEHHKNNEWGSWVNLLMFDGENSMENDEHTFMDQEEYPIKKPCNDDKMGHKKTDQQKMNSYEKSEKDIFDWNMRPNNYVNQDDEMFYMFEGAEDKNDEYVDEEDAMKLLVVNMWEAIGAQFGEMINF